MNVLRIKQSAVGKDRYRVEVSLEGPGLAWQAVNADFDFGITDQDREDMRWYLEDFLDHDIEPAPSIAARIEQRMAEIGDQLFQAVFNSTADAGRLWNALYSRLDDTRIEIGAEIQEAFSIPWELIRDPQTQAWLALRAPSFARVLPRPAQPPDLPARKKGPIRVLLVICRPEAGDDIPFRAAARRIFWRLKRSEDFEIHVLRPPTFDALRNRLHQARDQEQPFHVVHFDGHGTFEDVLAEGGEKARPLLLNPPRPGAHGYVLFESPGVSSNRQLVDGPALGGLMVENRVPVLVLDACQTAYAEPREQPDYSGDPHALVRAFGSMAQEVMDQGVPGVVAMRYMVYVETAAVFAAEMYAGLAEGLTLGQAVSRGRKQLQAQPLREAGFNPKPLQDWSVPTVYEAGPIALLPKPGKKIKLNITLDDHKTGAGRGQLDPRLPPRPEAGFIGRDETILALDRAFDRHSIVLLHAYAGAGKTAAAAEFARWYDLTGGIEGPVLFTSFERKLTVERVVEQVGAVFGPVLEANGINWLSYNEEERRSIALQVLKQIPVLWIWDNMEPVAGFPAGSESAWSKDEQDELKDFLRALGETKAKVLLTSRRDEQGWLGLIPARIRMPAMPFPDRVQLARALASKYGKRILDVKAWAQLLRYTQGNPLTVTVLVGQAVRQGHAGADQIERFVSELRSGEGAVEDDESQGRTRSLAASLKYGFENAFTEDELKVLALLHLFQGFVDVDALRIMGDPDKDWCLNEIKGLSREAGIKLLDRAAEAGLLTAHGGGAYSIHPALPWYFQDLFNQYYLAESQEPRAVWAYTEVMGWLGQYYNNHFNEGHGEVISVLELEEDNLLYSRTLAMHYSFWGEIIGAMQGLRTLYDHTGRRAEWKRLVDEIVPLFIDLGSDRPLPGREDAYSSVMQYRVRLARQARQWKEAEKLLKKLIDWDRRAVQNFPDDGLDRWQRNSLASLASSLHELGQMQREQDDAACVESFRQTYDIDERIGDRAGCASCAFNLGHAYKNIPSIRNIDQAESWYKKTLEMSLEGDKLLRGRCISQLGQVALERFKEAGSAGRPAKELLEHLELAEFQFRLSLDMFPNNAVNELSASHNSLGETYGYAGLIDQALQHFNESIKYNEYQGELYRAAITRHDAAIALAWSGRFLDALDYARAALRNFESFGDRAADDIQKTSDLIAQIESRLKSSGG